jgi:L-threonylcarbamoyladenylate synthase
MPSHPVALELIRRAGVPVAAPSANRFGHTSPTTAEHVLEDLDGRIDAVVDAGPTAFGVESTVLDPTLSPMVVYRPGAITLAQICAVAGPAEAYAEKGVPRAEPEPRERAGLPSPGVGLRHYAPKARLMLLDTGDDGPLTVLREAVLKYPGERAGAMWPEALAAAQSGFATVFAWGDWSQPAELAQRLFAGLRFLDAEGCTVILCPVPSEQGIGAAIGDRLRKAQWHDPSGAEL